MPSRLMLVASASLLAGCSLLTRPMEHPVIEDSMRMRYFGKAELGVLSMTPERRVVIHRYGSDIFCAENPTETGIELSSAAKLLTSAELPDNKKAELGIALANASANQVLNPRTQGMQFYLASAYNLCQMVLNKKLSDTQYREDHLAFANRAAQLIALEIVAGSVRAQAKALLPKSAASAVEQSMADVQKLLPDLPKPASKPASG